VKNGVLNMNVKYRQLIISYEMVHWYVHDNGHGHTIQVNFTIKYVCYMSLGSNGCFVTSAALMGGHCKIYIISGVSHPKSDSVILLVLWTVAYNIRDTNVVL
jgi:hypothetical protein